jgi:hypothetical protein
MSAIDKEKIFVELRQYHTDAFPDKLSTKEMDSLREDFVELEDNIVTMLLNLVNGKVGYVDFQKELADFQKKVKVSKTTDPAETKNRVFFASKIEHLNQILDIARASIFRLKIPRVAKNTAIVSK